MPFGPSTNLGNYYQDIESCLQDNIDNFSLVVLELLQAVERHNQTNPLKTQLAQSTITSPTLESWFKSYRPNDHELKKH